MMQGVSEGGDASSTQAPSSAESTAQSSPDATAAQEPTGIVIQDLADVCPMYAVWVCVSDECPTNEEII